jgi:fructokinase
MPGCSVRRVLWFPESGQINRERKLLERLAELGLSSCYISLDRVHPTGSVSVTLDSKGNPDYIIHENVAWDHIPFDEQTDGLAKSVDAVCFGTLAQRSPESRESIRRFLKSVSESRLKVFDINLRMQYYSPELINDSLLLCNVLKVNSEELSKIGSMFSLSGEPEETLSILCEKYNLRLIALTKGSEGSVLYTPEEILYHPGFKVDVCDTVGAGDAFTAALTIGVLEGKHR